MWNINVEINETELFSLFWILQFVYYLASKYIDLHNKNGFYCWQQHISFPEQCEFLIRNPHVILHKPGKQFGKGEQRSNTLCGPIFVWNSALWIVELVTLLAEAIR